VIPIVWITDKAEKDAQNRMDASFVANIMVPEAPNFIANCLDPALV
jgi:hypothetical protein